MPPSAARICVGIPSSIASCCYCPLTGVNTYTNDRSEHVKSAFRTYERRQFLEALPRGHGAMAPLCLCLHGALQERVQQPFPRSFRLGDIACRAFGIKQRLEVGPVPRRKEWEEVFEIQYVARLQFPRVSPFLAQLQFLQERPQLL